ncbi:MAG: EAL domain-containing protein [Oscillospiraceae bacterium]
MRITKNIRSQFTEVLDKRKVHAVYQPIVSLCDGSVYGYEALSRIDLTNCSFNTEEMFRIAEKLDCLWELESICRKISIKGAKAKPSGAKLFVNVDPNVIHDRKFRSGVTSGYLKRYDINPDDIVFEITERTSIDDAKTFRKSIEHYTKQNYKIAIDDFGSEYAGPNRICLLNPDIIKIDMAIVRDVDKDKIKRTFVKSLSIFGKNSGIKILAEGIETADELKTLIDLDVDYGQGYYLGKPIPEFAQTSEEVMNEIQKINNECCKLPGGKLFKFLKEHSDDDCILIHDEAGNFLEKLSCAEIKEIVGHTSSIIENKTD